MSSSWFRPNRESFEQASGYEGDDRLLLLYYSQVLLFSSEHHNGQLFSTAHAMSSTRGIPSATAQGYEILARTLSGTEMSMTHGPLTDEARNQINLIKEIAVFRDFHGNLVDDAKKAASVSTPAAAGTPVAGQSDVWLTHLVDTGLVARVNECYKWSTRLIRETEDQLAGAKTKTQDNFFGLIQKGADDKFLPWRLRWHDNSVPPEFAHVVTTMCAEDRCIKQVNLACSRPGSSIKIPDEDTIGCEGARVSLLIFAAVSFMASENNDCKLGRAPWPVLVMIGLNPNNFHKMKNSDLKDKETSHVRAYFDDFVARFPESLLFADSYAVDGKHPLGQKRSREVTSFGAAASTHVMTLAPFPAHRRVADRSHCWKCLRSGNDCQKDGKRECKWLGLANLIQIQPGAAPKKPLLTEADRQKWTMNDIAEIPWVAK